MMPKIKPRICTHCESAFIPGNLPGSTIKSKVCSISCAIEVSKIKAKDKIEKKIKKQKMEEKRAFNQETKRLKDAAKTRNQWMAEAQTVFNKYIRLRDEKEPCISCMRLKETVECEDSYMTKGCWDAGHYKSRGAKPQLRFNLWNVHKQCKSCNAGHANWGDTDSVSKSYEINLINKIGKEKVEFLNNNNDSRKFDIEYLKRIIVIFKKKTKALSLRH